VKNHFNRCFRSSGGSSDGWKEFFFKIFFRCSWKNGGMGVTGAG
jgi:hypothetical protein